MHVVKAAVVKVSESSRWRMLSVCSLKRAASCAQVRSQTDQEKPGQRRTRLTVKSFHEMSVVSMMSMTAEVCSRRQQ